MKKEYEATNYESDLTDEQWEAIKEFFPSGNKSKYHKRSLVEASLPFLGKQKIKRAGRLI